MTFREEMDRIAADIERLPRRVRWFMRRRYRRLERHITAKRDQAIRRYWKS